MASLQFHSSSQKRTFWTSMILGFVVIISLFAWSLQLSWSQVDFSDIAPIDTPVVDTNTNIPQNQDSSNNLEELENTLEALQ